MEIESAQLVEAPGHKSPGSSEVRAAPGAEPQPDNPSDPGILVPSPTFFEQNLELRPEIIAGLVREGQIVALGGPYGVGKTPFLQNLTVCNVRGIPFCGRETPPRPVIAVDFESSGPGFKRGIINISQRYGVAVPSVPGELDAYLLNDDAKSVATAQLLEALASDLPSKRLSLLAKALTKLPNALVIIDPPEVLFRIDTGKKPMVLALYREIRLLLSRFPRAAFLLVFNMRKKDRKGVSQPSLLAEPREWLEEVCGTLDIMNRADVRLGMDFYGEDLRVINGVRRSEEMHPLIIRQVGEPPNFLSGFELCPPNQAALDAAFTPRQKEHWRNLPPQFRFEHATETIPRSSLYRLLERAKSLGLINERDGLWAKTVQCPSPGTPLRPQM